MFPIKAIAFIIFGILFANPAYSASNDAPVKMADMREHRLFSAAETHTPVRLRPGKPQIVRLNSAVGNVIVDDMPKNVTAIVYDEKSIAMIPHDIGAAHITVTGKSGEILMARYVIIADINEKYVRIRQTCKNPAEKDCGKVRVFYCPNLCYETHIVDSANQLATK